MTRVPAGNVKINIYFNEQVLAALRKMAVARGTTYSELIREACREYALKKGPSVIDDTKQLRDLSK